MSQEKQKLDVESLLVEYQAAQDSAQHHDNQVWNATAVIWGAELVLIGFVVQSIGNGRLKYSIFYICFLAILLLLYLWAMAVQNNSVKNQKYSRCKEIESVLHLQQHSKLHYRKYVGRFFYYLIIAIFIVVWIQVFITALSL